MRNLRIARRYGKALVLAAMDTGAANVMREQAGEILALFRESNEFGLFVADPMIPPTTKQEVFAQLFGDRLHPLMQGFLTLVIERRRERELEAILQEALRQLDEREGVEEALVRSFLPLTQAQQDAIAGALSRLRGRSMRLRTQIDASLAGGFIVQLGDTTFDASLTAQLERVRRSLAEG